MGRIRRIHPQEQQSDTLLAPETLHDPSLLSSPGPWGKGSVTQATLNRKLPDETVFENLGLLRQLHEPCHLNEYKAGDLIVRAARVNRCTETEYLMAWSSSAGVDIRRNLYFAQNAGALSILSVPIPDFRRPYGVLESYIDILAAGAISIQDPEAVGSLRVPFYLEEVSTVTNKRRGAKIHIFESPQLPELRRAAVMVAVDGQTTDFTAFQVSNSDLVNTEKIAVDGNLDIDGPNAHYLLHQSVYSPLDPDQRTQLTGYLAMARSIQYLPKGVPEGEGTF